ncbi:MAG TPA: ABC transporter ATP-binding protein [Burkholderiales bacterium]|nr:ABC transporter ATP-binding protein [Burkholderiales bacterium]
MPVLEVEGLSKTYGEGELAVHALREASFSVEAGELVALLGPSGSGKSTLLLCVSLIEAPSAGRIAVRGRTVWSGRQGSVDARRYRRENIGFIFQGHNLIPFLTAQENVALAVQLNGAPRRQAAERAAEILDFLEIGHRAAALPQYLSGGERQRVAIGRALANEPPIIFADEPTASLDSERGMKVMGLLRRVAREKRSAVIAVTHDHRMVEGFDSAYHMNDGRLGRADTISTKEKPCPSPAARPSSSPPPSGSAAMRS